MSGDVDYRSPRRRRIRVNPLHRPSTAPAHVASATAPDTRAAALAERLRARLADRGARRAGRRGRPGAPRSARCSSASARDLEVRLRPGVGTPRLVRGAVLQRAGANGKGADPDERTARAFLRTQRALLRLNDPDDELALERSDRDDLGRRHLRFASGTAACPVWPAGLIVHLDPGGNVDAMDGAFVPTPRFVAGAAGGQRRSRPPISRAPRWRRSAAAPTSAQS